MKGCTERAYGHETRLRAGTLALADLLPPTRELVREEPAKVGTSVCRHGHACVLKRLVQSVLIHQRTFSGGRQVKMDTTACKHGHAIFK
jgi:hypothetical protein